MAQKVWNVSDDPSTAVPARTIMVLGKTVLPGRFIYVDDKRLARAHKVKKDVEAGLLFVGPKLPAAYLASKQSKIHLKMPAGHKRAHGPDKPAKVVAKPAVKAAAKPAPKPAPKPAVKAEKVDEDKKKEKPAWKE
jgi:hypothetical protein